MPETEVVLFAESDGTCPLLHWLDGLPRKVQDKCIVRVERLAEMGHELRRPEADYLRDGTFELRVSYHGIHYRILYFFYGRTAVISHGLIKEKEVPSREIELTIKRRSMYAMDPEKHTYRE
ncbi:MAG: type II toxin-antitoxin system RelE/ParE family toxin [bacterium]|nr:type II toxin-antitoxin system RelE/ParE family toxin [bacterium]MDT8395266.1 type II toxin-antitoxin system RelE/ParE family toxin [bacterium]